MNFFLNLLINALILVFAIVSFFYHNYDYGWEIYFFKEISFFLPAVIFVIWVFKSYSRLKKLNIFKSQEGYKLSKSGWKKAIFNETLPFYFYIPLAIMLLTYVNHTSLFFVLLLLIILENIFFLMLGRNSFKILITSQSIIIAHNRQHLIFWSNVKSISFQYGGAMVILKNNKQFYISDLDFLNFNKWKDDIKSQALTKEIYLED
jgi:hypothetical protein